MARNKTVPAPPAMDLPMLPSDDLAPTVTATADIDHASEPTVVAETISEASTELPSLINRMKVAAEAARQKADANFNALVLKLAEQDDVSEAEVIAVVQAGGKSLDDLAAAVDRQKEINRLRAVLAEFAEADHEHNRTWAAVREFRAREKETLQALRIESKRVRGEHFTADRRINTIKEAAEQLGRMGLPVNLIPPPLPASTMRGDDNEALSVTELDHLVSAVA